MCQVRHLDVEAGSSSLCLLMRGSTSPSLLYLICALCTVHCKLHSEHCSQCTRHCTMRGSTSLSLSLLCTVHCLLPTAHCSIYLSTSLHFTMKGGISLSLLCTVHCTLSTAHCSIYTVYFTALYNKRKHLSLCAVPTLCYKPRSWKS